MVARIGFGVGLACLAGAGLLMAVFSGGSRTTAPEATAEAAIAVADPAGEEPMSVTPVPATGLAPEARVQAQVMPEPSAPGAVQATDPAPESEGPPLEEAEAGEAESMEAEAGEAESMEADAGEAHTGEAHTGEADALEAPEDAAPMTVAAAGAAPAPRAFEAGARNGEYHGKRDGRPFIFDLVFSGDGTVGGSACLKLGPRRLESPVVGRWSREGSTLRFHVRETTGPRPANYEGVVRADGKANGTWSDGRRASGDWDGVR